MGDWRYSFSILDLGTRWMGESGQLHGHGRAPRIHWIGGSVARRSVLDAVKEIMKLSPLENRTLAIQPLARRCTD
jgi:hypothetical protein